MIDPTIKYSIKICSFINDLFCVFINSLCAYIYFIFDRPIKKKVTSTADIVVLAKDDNKNKILLIKRGKNPFKGYWAFPGGRIEPTDEDIMYTAKRELKEETGLDNIELTYVTTIGNKFRDPRGFTSTSLFLAKLNQIPTGVCAGDDAVDYYWFDVNDLPNMAFDHKDIFDKCCINNLT